MLEQYTNDPVGSDLSERELALLIQYPANPGSVGDFEGAYQEAVKRAQGILDQAILVREGKRCESPGCTTQAAFTVADPNREANPIQVCKPHLGQLASGDGPWEVSRIR